MNRRLWLMVAATAAVWGASYLFIKVALEDFSEGSIVCIRVALGAALLLAIAGQRGELGRLRGRMPWVAVIALIQVVLPFMLITFGENHVSSSLTAILIATVPIFTALLALGFDHAERSTGWAAVGVLVGIVGVVLLFGVDLSGDGDEIMGGAFMLVAALSYAISWMLVKHKLAGLPPVAVSGATMAVATAVTLPLLVATPPPGDPQLDSVLSLIALGAGGTGLAFVLYHRLIGAIGPARASVVGYVAPAFSIVYGVVLLDESLSAASFAGLALILAGSWLGAQGRLPGWLSRSGPSRSTEPAPLRAR